MPSQKRSGHRETLVVVSNRLPYNLPKEAGNHLPKRNVGGLVNALEPVLAARQGSWIGWDGISLSSAGAVSDVSQSPRSFRTETGIDLYGVPLSEREMSRYYHGFSNRALWPLFHDLLPTATFLPEDYTTYSRINRRFAETILALAGPKDRIWVHDYHLLLVPGFLRRMGFRGRVDFFLHIPFPAPEIFRALPWREELMKGMLDADAVAFQIRTYRDNFVQAAELLMGARSKPVGGDEYILEHLGGSTVAGVAPIGVEVEEYERIADLPSVARRVQKIKATHRDRKIIFGADRLDYTKGIKERFLALESLLTAHPETARTFEMVQIVVPSRHQVEEYRALKREIDEVAGRINGQYGQEGWAPICYRYRALDREELVAHYRAASIALVTPLKDGMNLVAPEFVASRTDDNGVLVISEMAGVAERLQGALLVNPYDREGCASAIATALRMEEDERRTRMVTLRRQVRANPLSVWAEGCLGLGLAEESLKVVTVGEDLHHPPLAGRPSLGS